MLSDINDCFGPGIIFYENYPQSSYFYIYYFIKQEKIKNHNFQGKKLCILISFNNPNKACFSSKKYTVLIQTHRTQIENSNSSQLIV